MRPARFFVSVLGLFFLAFIVNVVQDFGFGSAGLKRKKSGGGGGDGTTGNLVLNTSSMSLVNTSTSNANLVNTSGSTQTKSGGLNVVGNVGIGSADPKGKLLISDGAFGGTLPNPGEELTMEDNTHVAIQFLSPNDAYNSIYFGDPQNTGAGSIVYQHDVNSLNFTVNEVGRINIKSNGNVGIGTTNPSSKFEVFDGSITVQGTNAGINVQGGTLTAQGIIISSFQTRGVTYNFPPADGSADQLLATAGNGQLSWATGGGGGGNNQTINTSTVTLQILAMNGAIDISTSPFVAFPQTPYSIGKGTFNVLEFRVWTAVPSSPTAESSTIFRFAKSTSTSGGAGPFTYKSSSATISAGDRFSNWISSAFAILPGEIYAMHCTSSTTGPTTKAEYAVGEVYGWYSP